MDPILRGAEANHARLLRRAGIQRFEQLRAFQADELRERLAQAAYEDLDAVAENLPDQETMEEIFRLAADATRRLSSSTGKTIHISLNPEDVTTFVGPWNRMTINVPEIELISDWISQADDVRPGYFLGQGELPGGIIIPPKP
jgi:hypothetical protein